MDSKITTSKNLETNTKSKIQKLINYLSFVPNAEGEPKSSYNKITLLGTLLLITIGVYLFSIFYVDFEKFNAARKSSIIGDRKSVV